MTTRKYKKNVASVIKKIPMRKLRMPKIRVMPQSPDGMVRFGFSGIAPKYSKETIIDKKILNNKEKTIQQMFNDIRTYIMLENRRNAITNATRVMKDNKIPQIVDYADKNMNKDQFSQFQNYILGSKRNALRTDYLKTQKEQTETIKQLSELRDKLLKEQQMGAVELKKVQDSKDLLNKQLDELKNEKLAKDDQMKELKSDIEELELKTAQYMRELDEITKQKNDIIERNEQITTEQQKRIDYYTKRITNLTDKISQNEHQIDRMSQTMKENIPSIIRLADAGIINGIGSAIISDASLQNEIKQIIAVAQGKPIKRIGKASADEVGDFIFEYIEPKEIPTIKNRLTEIYALYLSGKGNITNIEAKKLMKDVLKEEIINKIEDYKKDAEKSKAWQSDYINNFFEEKRKSINEKIDALVDKTFKGSTILIPHSEEKKREAVRTYLTPINQNSAENLKYEIIGELDKNTPTTDKNITTNEELLLLEDKKELDDEKRTEILASASASEQAGTLPPAGTLQDKKELDDGERKQSAGLTNETKGLGLYNDEIETVMKNIKNFNGVVSRDEILTKILPKIKPYSRGGFIINTDKSNEDGTHWFSIVYDARPEEVGGSKTIEYYDSFGRDVPADLLDDIAEIAKKLGDDEILKLKVNKVKNQSNTSENCGWFSMKFIIDRIKRNKTFSEATGYNDKIVEASKKGEGDIEKFKEAYISGNGIMAGDGFVDTLKKGISKTADFANELWRRIKNFIMGINEMSPNVKNMIEKYGQAKINKITVWRAPIQSAVKKIMDVVSLGDLEKNKEKLKSISTNYDDIYHLAMVIDTDMGPLSTEKIPRVVLNEGDISNKVGFNKAQAQKMDIPITKTITVGELFNNAIQGFNNNQSFFNYHPVNLNCQHYITQLLKYSNLLSSSANEFINQDVQQLFKGTQLEGIATFITQTKHKFDGLLGRGEQPKMTEQDIDRHNKIMELQRITLDKINNAGKGRAVPEKDNLGHIYEVLVPALSGNLQAVKSQRIKSIIKNISTKQQFKPSMSKYKEYLRFKFYDGQLPNKSSLDKKVINDVIFVIKKV